MKDFGHVTKHFCGNHVSKGSFSETLDLTKIIHSKILTVLLFLNLSCYTLLSNNIWCCFDISEKFF